MGQQIKVAIVGAGISGLAVANGLLNDPENRFDVQLYDRDTVAYDLERGGYQIRVGYEGLNALKTVTSEETWDELQKMWGGDTAKAPVMVNPDTFDLCLDLSQIKLYPQSRPIPRTGLKHVLLRLPLSQRRIHYSHTFCQYELSEERGGGVTIHFVNQPPVQADMLIAADGSGSKINQLVGLNNKIKLDQWTLVQARGPITRETYDKLPQSLQKYHSCMYLGGNDISGFASVYNHKQILGPTAGEIALDCKQENKDHTLFWAVLIPASKGQSILEESEGDHQEILRRLIDYLRSEINVGEAIPTIFEAAPGNMRTGFVTSSFKPASDWRAGKSANNRIILIGDALHPMTPGRGMGANQALTDAGNLVNALRRAPFKGHVPTDEELCSLVRPFDSEMYERAFAMVKASEDMSALDLRSAWTRNGVTIVKAALTVLGWCASVLESVGLRTSERLDFAYRKH